MSSPAPTRRQPPELFDRLMARAIDMTIWFLLTLLVPPAGTLFGLIFWLLCDGLFGGASPGKHAVGLLVLHKDHRRPATLKESALRNVPFAIPALLLILPIIGPIVAAAVGIPVLLLELYFLLSDPEQVRLGDVFADTRVVSAKPRRKKRKRVKGPFEPPTEVDTNP